MHNNVYVIHSLFNEHQIVNVEANQLECIIVVSVTIDAYNSIIWFSWQNLFLDITFLLRFRTQHDAIEAPYHRLFCFAW